MSTAEREISIAGLRELVMGTKEQVGLYAQVLGFRTATGSIKGVHVMNDLAQSVLGGAPSHRGDLLCQIIRQDIDDPRHDNTDTGLRASAHYRQAYPEELGGPQIYRLREAARLLLNFDGGMYRPGDGMASGLATHWTLLGAEGFRRFGLGRYLTAILGEPGRARLEELYRDKGDPVTQALRPLLKAAPLQDSHPERLPLCLAPFDEALGRRLTVLLQQPLSKPMLLRYTLLASSLGLVLKVLGAGRPDGRPVVLALPEDPHHSRRSSLRQEAVQSLSRGLELLDRRLALALPDHPLAAPLWQTCPTSKKAETVTMRGPTLEVAALALVEAARELKGVYPPRNFAIALGKKAGCIQPRRDNAGWGKRLALHPDLLEALILMYVPDGAPPLRWPVLWAQVRDELGLIIGANSYEDAQALKRAGVVQLSLSLLARSSEEVLELAVRRGVARRLPDSGAEASGVLL